MTTDIPSEFSRQMLGQRRKATHQ